MKMEKLQFQAQKMKIIYTKPLFVIVEIQGGEINIKSKVGSFHKVEDLDF